MGQNLPDNVPAMMQAIGVSASGGPEVLELADIKTPQVGANDVLIKVVYSGVNRPDCIQREGRYPVPPGASPIMGLEVAGEVVVIGADVPAEMLGARVCALTPGGGYAEYCTAPWDHCLNVPDDMLLLHAAAIPETLFTVWHNVFERGLARDGETLLVHGGTSGIGTMAIMLAKAFDMKVVATCGDDTKCEAARGLGADLVVNYKTSDFVEETIAFTNGKGADVVLDMVGGDYVPRNLKALGEDGRHVSIAMLTGAKTELFIPLVMSKRLILTGSMLRPRSDAFKSALCDEIARSAWPLFTSGELKPVLDQTFALAEAGAAHTRMEAGQHIGKIMLEVAKE